MNGAEVLILVDTDGQGTYVAVASQMNASISESNALIDESSKDQRERKVSAGRYEATYSFDALYVVGDVAHAALKAAMRNGTKIMLREQMMGVPIEQVVAVITDMTREYPDQESATISLEAAVDGQITPI